MRKFNFNSFKKNQDVSPVQTKEEQKPRFSAYRTIISRHDAINSRLKDEPVSPIKCELQGGKRALCFS